MNSISMSKLLSLLPSLLVYFRLHWVFSGFIIYFLSKATLIGFMSGAAILVSLQQLKGLFGIIHFTGKMQIIPVLDSVFSNRKEVKTRKQNKIDTSHHCFVSEKSKKNSCVQWSWKTMVMGFCFLVILLAARQIVSYSISLKKPKLFWISVVAPLTSVILSTILVYVFRSKFHDISQMFTTIIAIKQIGRLQKGVNPSSANMLFFNGPQLSLAIKTGIVTGILSLTGIAVGRTFASMENYQIDGNKEMTAVGIMNMAGSCASCYVSSGSFSRSAVNYNAGAKTAISNIVMAATVLITLLFLMPLFTYTPNLILSAIIVTAVIGLIDYEAAFKLWKLDKIDFLACSCSFFGVLFISVQIGLAIAVGVSVFKIILHVTRPNTLVLGNIPGTQIYRSVNRYENASRVPSFPILGIESPIFFANSSYLQERILRWIREEETKIEKSREETLKCVVLDMTAVTAIDTSGIDAISELQRRLSRRSLKLVLVNPVGTVTEKLHHSKILDLFQSNGLYLTVGEAVGDISSLLETSVSNG
ncbi:sulfate transporter 3.4 isoform X1 [Tripterygium wilfordii]|uniref:Sulfate transporter 3.4 isoform X1 n=1 Tax=Tripterygium wilfordii TaxID=458696 RepID=A0A7J7DA48_TRIWF|nr:sulfate transporter 3.4 isoform X1 [Tripterygium wilfordii]